MPTPLPDPHRRALMQQGGLWAALIGCGLLTAGQAQAALDGAGFDAHTLDGVLKALGGKPADSRDISIQAPDTAENGAVVPIQVSVNTGAALPRVQELFIVIEKNPNPLAAGYSFADGTEPFIATRVKMAETCRVHAIVRADGRLLSASREVKVTLGGCGA